MRIYAITGHRYEDLGAHRLYVIPERGWLEVPEDVGRLLLRDHSPQKLVDITGEDDPEAASSRLRAGLPLREPPAEAVVEEPAAPKPSAMARSKRRR